MSKPHTSHPTALALALALALAQAEVCWSDETKQRLSQEARDFVESLLAADPDKRLTAVNERYTPLSLSHTHTHSLSLSLARSLSRTRARASYPL